MLPGPLCTISSIATVIQGAKNSVHNGACTLTFQPSESDPAMNRCIGLRDGENHLEASNMGLGGQGKPQ